MKLWEENRKNFKSGFLIPGVLSISLALFLLPGCNPARYIQSPYSHVDWAKYDQYKSNLHTHTTVRGGWMNPQSVVTTYKNSGYAILAITDHSAITYPWEEFSKLKPEDRTRQRIIDKVPKPSETEPMKLDELEYKDVRPSEIGMVAIKGNEISYLGHDINSYYNNYNGTKPEVSLDSIASRGGISVLNHPGRYKFSSKWYADVYNRYNHIVGIEVFNCGNRYPNDRQKWDSILTILSPSRPVWGFSNDDFHSMRDFGRNWNVFLLPELNQIEVRKAMENGIFYFVNAPEGQKGQKPSEILSMEVNSRKKYISIVAANCDSIAWISNGLIVGHGNILDIRKLPASCRYVRAELYGKGNSVVCTQPFNIISSR